MQKRVGVRRKTAQRLVEELRLRATQIDADPRFLYGVSRLAVFGSYVSSDKPKLGDIDIAVELGPKERNPERHWELCDKQQNEATASASVFDRIYWPETKVWKALRAGHSSFSLHEYTELEALLRAGKAECVVLHRNKRFDRESFFRPAGGGAVVVR